jgi:hypothetical protein
MNKNEELEYLMNPTLYDKYKQTSAKDDNYVFLKDKKFYRKRIQQMAKECSKYGIVKNVEEPPTSLLNAFNSFAKHCISHFKTVDEAEFYQDEYNGMENNDNMHTNTNTNTEKPTKETVNNLNTDFLITNSGEKKIVSIDDFVTKKKGSKTTKPLHLPKQKIADVTQDKYRTKGVKEIKSKEIKSKGNIDGMETGNV